MDKIDYYDNLESNQILNPSDLNKTFQLLVAKIEILEKTEAPKMLISFMLDLALEIERNRQEALVVMNPMNPEPLSIPIFISCNHILSEKQRVERAKILRVFKKCGWYIKPGQSYNFIELSVANYEYATIEV